MIHHNYSLSVVQYIQHDPSYTLESQIQSFLEKRTEPYLQYGEGSTGEENWIWDQEHQWSLQLCWRADWWGV